MNKEEAAKELGISVRSLQRAVQDGKVKKPVLRRGRSGKMEADFNADEIARYKDKLNEVIRPEEQDSKANLLAMTRRDEEVSQFVALIKYLADALKTNVETRPPAGTVPIADKLSLSLAEAAALAGLSKNFLLNDIHAGKLKAVIRGRGWSIKRKDLDAYIKKL